MPINKPCPFCGSYPEAMVKDYGSGVRYLNVGCFNEVCLVEPQAAGTTLELAWEKWNKRHEG